MVLSLRGNGASKTQAVEACPSIGVIGQGCVRMMRVYLQFDASRTGTCALNGVA